MEGKKLCGFGGGKKWVCCGTSHSQKITKRKNPRGREEEKKIQCLKKTYFPQEAPLHTLQEYHEKMPQRIGAEN